MFKFICLFVLTFLIQTILGDDDARVCHETKPDGSVVDHYPGDKWLELPSETQSKKASTVIIKYMMECIQHEDYMQTKPVQCYFEGITKPKPHPSTYLNPGCMKVYDNWLLKCAWNNDILDANFAYGAKVQQKRGENEGLKLC